MELVATYVAAIAAVGSAAFAWHADRTAEEANRIAAEAVAQARVANGVAGDANDIAREATKIQTLATDPKIRVWPTRDTQEPQWLASCRGTSETSPYTFVGLTTPTITIRNLGARSADLIRVSLENSSIVFRDFAVR